MAQDPDVFGSLIGARTIIDGVHRSFLEHEEWRETVADPKRRVAVWDQLNGAHLLLDRVLALMLEGLSKDGWEPARADKGEPTAAGPSNPPRGVVAPPRPLVERRPKPRGGFEL